MQLGKALIGALIGGAIGIGLLIAVHYFAGWDQTWWAIGVAVLVGLGVRLMVDTKGHASYARGGLTAVAALVAFVVGTMLVAEVAKHRTVAAAGPVPAVDAERPAEEPADGDDAVEAVEPPPAEMPAGRQGGAGAIGNARLPRTFSPVDFVWLVFAAFIAYELGRGSGAAAATAGPAETRVDSEDEPAATA